MAAKVIPVACPSCGAKLKVPAATETVECEYCGMESFVQRRAGVLDRPVAVPEHAKSLPVAQQPHSRAWVGGLVFVLAVFLGPPLAIALHFAFADYWIGTSLPIVVDVDGNGTLDIVGKIKRGEEDAHVAAYDGADGSVLWVSDEVGTYSDAVSGTVAVVGTTVIFVDAAGNASGFDGKTGETKWSGKSLGEKLEALCTGEDGSVVASLRDDTYRRISLSDGAVSPHQADDCAPTHSDGRLAPPDIEFIKVSHRPVGGVDAELAVRRGEGWLVYGGKRKGTSVPTFAALGDVPRATLENHEPIEARWELPIPAMDALDVPSHEVKIAVSDDTAYAAYAIDDKNLRVTAFAIADGTRRWDNEVDAEDRSPEALVHAQGRVYLAIWGTLFVLDAKTGDTLFEIGQ